MPASTSADLCDCVHLNNTMNDVIHRIEVETNDKQKKNISMRFGIFFFPFNTGFDSYTQENMMRMFVLFLLSEDKVELDFHSCIHYVYVYRLQTV